MCDTGSSTFRKTTEQIYEPKGLYPRMGRGKEYKGNRAEKEWTEENRGAALPPSMKDLIKIKETRAEYVTGMLKFGCCHAITAAKSSHSLFGPRFSEIYQNLKNKLIAHRPAPPRSDGQRSRLHTRRSVKNRPTYSAPKGMDSCERQFMSESLCASAFLNTSCLISFHPLTVNEK